MVMRLRSATICLFMLVSSIEFASEWAAGQAGGHLFLAQMPYEADHPIAPRARGDVDR